MSVKTDEGQASRGLSDFEVVALARLETAMRHIHSVNTPDELYKLVEEKA